MPAAVAIPLITAAASTGTALYGAHAASSASRNAARAAGTNANHAADLEAQAARDALAFEQSQDVANRAERTTMQNRNYGLYQDALQRQAPYTQMGTATLGQLTRPPGQMGTLRDLNGGR